MPAKTAADAAAGTLPRRYADACQLTDRLFQTLAPDALYARPIPERHRLIFYRGHLEAFDWNLLSERLLGQPRFHASFDRLFAFGIDPVDGQLPLDQPRDWPTRAEVEAYCAEVRAGLRAGLAPSRWQALPDAERDQLFSVAIEHRLMHAETLAYLFHQLPFHQKLPQPGHAWPDAPAPAPRMVSIPAGDALLGRERDEEGFGWDNEFLAHRISVPAFEIDTWPVTNAAFLPFVEAGGYDDRSLWTGAGWAWRESVEQQHPFFWRQSPEGWRLHGMFAERPLPPADPVYVTWAEAGAYARWQGKALPTEAEWHRAAYATPQGDQRPFPWGAAAPDARRGHFDFAGWDPAPVDAHPAGQSAFGVHDLAGNGWEWTSTPFGPFPGFEPFSFYPGYSANFFDNQHYVLKGGSSQTAACMLRRSFRNWFQPHYPFPYATFRCVRR